MFRRTEILLICFFLISCGIEEYYYLPQHSVNNISVSTLNEAVIDFPSVSSSYYYVANYEIFYRIYISDYLAPASINTLNDMSKVSPSLASDYRSFEPITDPTNTSSITSTNTFKNRNYFKLELYGERIDSVLSKDGGSLTITFPTGADFPSASFNGTRANLRRSSDLISPEPWNDLSFRNTSDLRNNDKASANINADVAGRSGNMSFAYVSMYIVLTGTNPVNFSTIYSKPTHISIFKLPDF